MIITAKCLHEPGYVNAADTSLYVAPINTHTIIDKFTAYNNDASARILIVNLIPSGGAADVTNIVAKVSIAAGGTWDSAELKNQILNPGDIISANAAVASMIVARVSGREIT